MPHLNALCHSVRVVRDAQVAVRAATAADEAAIVRCVLSAYERYVPLMDNKPAPMLADYGQLICDGLVQVAEADAAIVGVLVMWAEPDHFYVDSIAVDLKMQGRGIAAIFLELAEEAAVASGRDEIRLYTNEVMASNIDYYLRRGFVETHRSVDNGYRRVYFTRKLKMRDS